ncbi:MAG: hypothetical protein COS45_00545 [Candidatus Huberarchaeum crystalense]|uniref:Uncharacterized protein n=1 Tax=Huberarchaeum crystalense TaxID=2014257 RepID=A0A2H9M2V5_HUBC1|nr:MAG: hypothetical protein COS45_00545 [Candidatus Huberarchaeum crystalense]
MENLIKRVKKIYAEDGFLGLCCRIFTKLNYYRALKIGGFKAKINDLVIYLNPDDKVVSLSIFRGNYEVEETKLFKDMLSPGIVL